MKRIFSFHNQRKKSWLIRGKSLLLSFLCLLSNSHRGVNCDHIHMLSQHILPSCSLRELPSISNDRTGRVKMTHNVSAKHIRMTYQLDDEQGWVAQKASESASLECTLQNITTQHTQHAKKGSKANTFLETFRNVWQSFGKKKKKGDHNEQTAKPGFSHSLQRSAIKEPGKEKTNVPGCWTDEWHH